MRTKVLGYGKLVPLEADRDLEVDSKHQDKSRYPLSDTGMLLLKEFTVPLYHAQVVRATSRETNIGDLVGVMWDTQKVLSQLFSPMAFRETGGHIYTRILH
jgi:hypothetical protein